MYTVDTRTLDPVNRVVLVTVVVMCDEPCVSNRMVTMTVVVLLWMTDS